MLTPAVSTTRAQYVTAGRNEALWLLDAVLGRIAALVRRGRIDVEVAVALERAACQQTARRLEHFDEFEAGSRTVFPTVVVDHRVPPGEAHLTASDGTVVGRITGIGCE